MKLLKLITLCVAGIFAISNVSGQANASINVLTLNAGQVNQGAVVDVQVTVGNTGPVSPIGVNKVRAQISIPTAIASALPNAQQTGLPPGWTILSNTGGVIQVCNGSDIIPVGQQRQVLIKVQGNTVGGPSTVSGVLSFGPGTGVCTGLGTLAGNNTADDISQSTIQVLPAPPCTLTVSAAAGTIACNGGTTTLTATPAGAGGTVEYSITGGDPFQLSNTFTVPVGTYTVTAREVSNPTCIAASSPVIITEPTVITASASAGTIACNGGTTTLTVTAAGGTGALEYSLNAGPFQPGNTFTVGAGTYTVTVRDANLCTVNAAPVIVTEPTVITASASAGTIACNGGTTTLTVTAAGGSGALEYSLNAGPFQPGNTFTVGAGTYTVTVRDANLCTVNAAPVTVTAPTAVSASAAVTIPIPIPGGTGTITVTSSGGTGIITYVITSGTTINATGATSGIFTNLLAGSYIFTATDANGCTGTASVTLSNPVAGPANASINILTLNAGQVAIGGTVDIQVTVGNTGPSFIGFNKVRAQISIPTAIASALPNAQQTGLPPGWIILSNTGGVIQVCNGSDAIPAGTQRQVLIKVQGDAIGGPSTVSGVLSFGPGTGVCTGLGSLSGNITADDVSQSTITVSATLPVTLTDFDAKLVNCIPVLHWVTQTEINSDRFEIERAGISNSAWVSAGVVAANGNTTGKTEYNFTDRTVSSSSEQVFYRLKMIDKDGHYKYSGILRVYINCNTSQVFVYPNPVQDGKLYVSLTGTGSTTDATLMTLAGQVVLKSKMNIGTNSLNVSALADGLYILTIKDDKGLEKKVKVFIQQ